MSGESLGTDGKAQYPHRVVFNVKALLFERQGLENLELRDVDTRELREGEVGSELRWLQSTRSTY
jgi:hypothetical protein